MQRDPAPPATPPKIEPGAIHRDARKIVRRLQQHGFDAYLVGGCVRDLLLGLRPKDFDIATNATPREVKGLFRNSRIIGRRFRLVHVRFGPRVIEVSTFRAPPPEAEDGDLYVERDNVFGTMEQDAFRRDFTINGLFYDPESREVVDHVGGLDDLARGTLRTIGDPDVRLREDPVRILRAARFIGKVDFEPTREFYEAAQRHAGELTRAAPPRVLEELYRLISTRGSAKGFRMFEELGGVDVLLPEITPLPPVFFEALEGIERLGRGRREDVPQSLMMAVLFYPAVADLLAEEREHDYEGAVQDVIRPIALRLTVSRRDLTRARQCLAAQVRLLRDPRGRSGRRYAQRDFFHEALVLRRLLGPVREVDPDPLPHWERLAHEVPPQPEKEQPPRRRKRGGRRRRRGRRRRGGGGQGRGDRRNDRGKGDGGPDEG